MKTLICLTLGTLIVASSGCRRGPAPTREEPLSFQSAEASPDIIPPQSPPPQKPAPFLAPGDLKVCDPKTGNCYLPGTPEYQAWVEAQKTPKSTPPLPATTESSSGQGHTRDLVLMAIGGALIGMAAALFFVARAVHSPK